VGVRLGVRCRPDALEAQAARPDGERPLGDGLGPRGQLRAQLHLPGAPHRELEIGAIAAAALLRDAGRASHRGHRAHRLHLHARLERGALDRLAIGVAQLDPQLVLPDARARGNERRVDLDARRAHDGRLGRGLAARDGGRGEREPENATKELAP
jgi:hypothetical protein